MFANTVQNKSWEGSASLKTTRDESDAQPTPSKRSKLGSGRVVTQDDLLILDGYYQGAACLQNEIAPDELLRTVKKIAARGGDSPFAFMQNPDFDLSRLQEKKIEVQNNPKRTLSIPFVKAVLDNYTRIFRTVSDWFPAYRCMFGIQKALKKNWQREDRHNKCIVVDLQSENDPKLVTMGLLSPHQKILYAARWIEQLGKGDFGSVYRVETDSLSFKAVKIGIGYGKKLLLNEWNVLHALHTSDAFEGIQSLPLAFERISTKALRDFYPIEEESKNEELYLMLQDEYDGNLRTLLRQNPSLFPDALSVFKAFLPLFETLAHAATEYNRVHEDIGQKNIFVKKSGEEVRLVLADWALSKVLSQEETDNFDTFKSSVQNTLAFFRKIETAKKNIVIPDLECTPEQLFALRVYILKSRDVYALGHALLKVLEVTLHDPSCPEWVLLRGWRCEDDPSWLKKVDEFLGGVANNYYEPNEIAGVSVDFPHRVTSQEAVRLLKEVIEELEKE